MAATSRLNLRSAQDPARVRAEREPVSLAAEVPAGGSVRLVYHIIKPGWLALLRVRWYPGDGLSSQVTLSLFRGDPERPRTRRDPVIHPAEGGDPFVTGDNESRQWQMRLPVYANDRLVVDVVDAGVEAHNVAVDAEIDHEDPPATGVF